MKTTVEIGNINVVMQLAGNLDEHFEYIEKTLNVTIAVKGNEISIEGEDALLGAKLIENLRDIVLVGNDIDIQVIEYTLDLITEDLDTKITDFYQMTLCVTKAGKSVHPKTIGQKEYVELIQNKSLIFGIGPAGTGKTYVAVAMAIREFKAGRVKKIIITRPAIEAGENLGFLPGDLQSKVDPYLRPIYDAMEEILGVEVYKSYKERGLIEIAPLAYMRGRTLDHAFIILDEAQNTTPKQMKMFLTRFGFGSKVVINGDVTQVDLKKEMSGLSHALKVLEPLNEIGVKVFKKQDVMRHTLVKKIINQYDLDEQGSIDL